jgi:outer membrane lipoprotein-sorting protein
MSTFTRRPAARWLVPAVVAVLLAAGGSTVGVLAASARGGLPHRSPSQLLVDVQKARLDGLSGTIVQTASLGLPSLPGVGGAGSSDMTSLVSGSHTLRLWYAGPNKVRLALLGSLGESDIVRNGTDLWTWSSKDKSATHRQVPLMKADASGRLPATAPVTPQRAADAALAAISPTTKVSTDGTAVVAGRTAYELVLQPRATGSLVESVRIAIDGRTHVPTRVQVFARGTHSPAFEVGFTSFDPSTPAASAFVFNPPPRTKVTEGSGPASLEALPGSGRSGSDRQRPDKPGSASADQGPQVVGTGWTSVVVAKVPSGSSEAAGSGSGQLARMLRVLPRVSGTWGTGHLLKGTLFSALLTDDGRLVVGAVAPEALYAALGR